MQANSEQQRVINELDKNLLLLASAGTGKTNTLAHRVAHIIETKKAASHQILCMTFTNKACKEMKDRILSIVGQEARAVEVSTFHSFCYKILQEEGKQNDGLYTDLVIYDEEDAKELWLPLKPEGMKDFNFQNLLNLVKEHRAIYDIYSDNLQADYEQTIEKLSKENYKALQDLLVGSWSVQQFKFHGAAVIIAYQRALANVHGVDFTDLITLVYELFRTEETRERWRKRFSYIAVDEMQDTSELEYLVMRQMWVGNTILLCGDYFQTIYEWRGSNPLLLLEKYEAEFKPETVVFYENYRSSQILFKAAFSVLQEMFPQQLGDFYKKNPYAVVQAEGKPIEIYEAPTEWLEGKYIYDTLRKYSEEDRASAGILVRNNYKAKDLSRIFENINNKVAPENRLDFMIIDDFKFFRRQEIKDVMAYFKLVVNPHDAVSAKRIIKRFVRGIGDVRLQEIDSSDCRKAGLKLTDFLDLRIFEEEPYARLLEGLEKKNVVVFDVESTGTDTTTDQIIQIAGIRIDQEGKVLEEFNQLILPTKSVGDSAAVHNFTDEILAEKGRPAVEVLTEFKEFSKDAIIVGHNVNYDVSIFTSELHRHNLSKPEFAAVYDTLDIFRRFYPNLPNHKLGFLSEYFPIHHKPTHNAFDDILATALILIYAVKENILPTQDLRKAFISTYKSPFSGIAAQMSTLRRKSESEKPTEVLTYIMKDMGVLTYYQGRGEENRIEYIRDFYRMLQELEEESKELNSLDRLKRILQLAALTAGEPTQQLRHHASQIPIITVHQAKGSEFKHVFLAGMTAGTFPSNMALKDGKEDEEKRLFYVALTRAKEDLTISWAKEGYRGKQMKASYFLDYIPRELIITKRGEGNA